MVDILMIRRRDAADKGGEQLFHRVLTDFGSWKNGNTKKSITFNFVVL